ncbi:hypothetical protein [uncultured Sanguibacteroides sp.]|nr:hypothetical protein [uncultured Sanguibacteroides sp.]
MRLFLYAGLFVFIFTSCGTSKEISSKILDLQSKFASLEQENIKLRDEYDQIKNENHFLKIEIESLKNGMACFYTKLDSVLNRAGIIKQIPIRSVTKTTSPSTPKSQSKKVSTTSESVYSGRCQATTKKGTQCKRNAQTGSRYCWQHQR